MAQETGMGGVWKLKLKFLQALGSRVVTPGSLNECCPYCGVPSCTPLGPGYFHKSSENAHWRIRTGAVATVVSGGPEKVVIAAHAAVLGWEERSSQSTVKREKMPSSSEWLLTSLILFLNKKMPWDIKFPPNSTSLPILVMVTYYFFKYCLVIF